MKQRATTHRPYLQNAIRIAARGARRKAFNRGFPVAVSKKGKVVLIYKDNREVNAYPSSTINSK